MHVKTSSNEAFFIGIDGGASKTSVALIDTNGRILAKARVPGSAFVGALPAATADLLRTAVQTVCGQAAVAPSRVAVYGAGLSGIDFADEFAMQERQVAACFGIDPSRLRLVNDGIVALWGSTAHPAAVLLQHGSYFTSAWRNRHGDERLYDHVNVACLFDLRAEVLAVTARMIDGRAAATPLKARVLAYLDIEDENMFAEKVFRTQVSAVKRQAIVPLVFDAWQAGDPAAARLVVRSLEDYTVTVAAMMKRVAGDTLHVVLGGGVISRAPAAFWQLLADRIHDLNSKAVVKPPDLSPEIGAAIMAAYAGHHDPEALFTRLQEGAA